MSKYYHFDYKGKIIADKTFDELSKICNEYSSARKGKKMTKLISVYCVSSQLFKH